MESEKAPDPDSNAPNPSRWKRMFGRSSAAEDPVVSRASSEGLGDVKRRPEKWSMGVLNDRETEEVPGEQMSSWLGLQFTTAWRLFVGDRLAYKYHIRRVCPVDVTQSAQ